MRNGQKIQFVYDNRRRFGRIHNIKTIQRDGRKIITCWIPAERCYKSFRHDKMQAVKIVKGFLESLFTWWC